MQTPTTINQFLLVMIFIISALLFLAGGLLASKFLRKQNPNVEKLSTYESGEEAQGNALGGFSFRYYTVAILFLLFTVEIALLIPWALAYNDKQMAIISKGQFILLALAELIVFVSLLAIGLAWAWKRGYLEWDMAKPIVTKIDTGIPDNLYRERNNTV